MYKLDGQTAIKASQEARVILLTFLVVQATCQIALMAPQLSSLRILFRTLAFAGSLGFFFFLPGRSKATPWRPWLYGVIAVYALGFLHPLGNTPQSAVALILLNIAIFAPAFWTTRLFVTKDVFAAVLYFLWGFATLSAGVGVLQVLYPDRFAGEVSAVVLSMGDFADGLKITLADGTQIWRPAGLTDSPGGAAGAGVTATLLSIGVFIGSRGYFVKCLCFVSISVGLFCIFLCQVRSAIVVLAVISLIISAGLFAFGRYQQLLGLVVVLVGLFVVVLGVSSQYGGDKMIARIETLIEENPQDVYTSSRGGFLEHTYGEMFDVYPFGAGLGRWGMMNAYFGTPDKLWVEIQWTAWLYDGGVVLMIIYAVAVLSALRHAVKVAYASAAANDEWLTGWALLIAGYNVGTIAMTFSYVPFAGQVGLEFWLLNGLLFTASRTAESARRKGGAAA